MDKIANKVKKIKQNAELLQLNCIKAFCYDGTKALSVEKREDKQGKVNSLGNSSIWNKCQFFINSIKPVSSSYVFEILADSSAASACGSPLIFFPVVIFSFSVKQLQNSNCLSLSQPSMLKRNAFPFQIVSKIDEALNLLTW